MMRRFGLIVNPIASMGGSVGLKGTDGVVDEAVRRGASPLAGEKALRALGRILPLKGEVKALCCAGAMGADALFALGIDHEVMHSPAAASSPADTKEAARAFAAAGADIIAFAGGDGTARDVYEAVGEGIPVLGIPAGVKIHSPVYARTPESAGELLRLFLAGKALSLREAEVIDINEDDYRAGTISTRLCGCLTVPFDRRMQGGKAPSPLSEKERQMSIAASIAEGMDSDACYLMGPGSTVRCLMERIGADCTLLGVDAVRGGRTVAKDVSETDILPFMEESGTRLVITPTGGQGCLLGRGNQQISPKVIKRLGKGNIIVAATREKLAALSGQPLLVDTGDPGTDEALRGYVKVVTGYHETALYPVE